MREIQRRLPSAEWHYHQWFQYREQDGSGGYAEPELFCVLKDRVLLFEVKLTGGIAGRMQMEGLYAPILSFIYKRPVKCCLVCKFITKETPGPFFQSAEQWIQSGDDFGTWHWLPTP